MRLEIRPALKRTYLKTRSFLFRLARPHDDSALFSQEKEKSARSCSSGSTAWATWSYPRLSSRVSRRPIHGLRFPCWPGLSPHNSSSLRTVSTVS